MGNQKTIVKQVTFPSELLKAVEKRANKYGLSLPEYIRHLVLNDIDESITYKRDDYVEILDEETDKEIAKSLDDYRKGRYTEVRNKKELKAFLKKLST